LRGKVILIGVWGGTHVFDHKEIGFYTLVILYTYFFSDEMTFTKVDMHWFWFNVNNSWVRSGQLDFWLRNRWNVYQQYICFINEPKVKKRQLYIRFQCIFLCRTWL